ncbi:hypothetical protein K353_05851 [Kitasatospora sp. SolWspMP-SS2h]|uniref:hypothetical protein n=1 Tax=Kitasatospora sp. SolWspMP-SS2h TaxID=1305729 RepID=UPI000DB9F71B|nr:hypothetical protein [Kitasatospora sp. SolWspMP-SS2h]RAJ32853.1 hypothetical protein K353_05851 [Kitasatospora sp. SolWspMP-SS2h]
MSTVEQLPQRLSPAYVALALADDPHPQRRRARNVPRLAYAAADLLLDRHPQLPGAVRGADQAEEAAYRWTQREHRQVLHLGFGVGLPQHGPHDWWTYQRSPRVVAVTTCEQSRTWAGLLYEGPAILLHRDADDLPGLLDDAALREHLDLARPLGIVLAGAHRTRREPLQELLEQLLAHLAAGSTLAVTGIRVEDATERRWLREGWRRHTGQRPALFYSSHHSGLLPLLARLEEIPGALAADLPRPHLPAEPEHGIRSVGAVYRIGGPA